MQTRIRHMRKMRGWTLQQLAERVGTTAQTIQRLETANMTVSMDWLDKLALAFNINAIELILDETQKEIAFLGAITAGGALKPDHEHNESDHFSLDIPADDPVAMKITQDIGQYRSGTIIIADRFTGEGITNALGHDVLAVNESDNALLCRLIKGASDSYTLVPILSGEPVRYDQRLKWAGRIVMQVLMS